MAGSDDAGRAAVLTASGAFDLGTVGAAPVLEARGHQGLVWRVDTDRGRFAVKQLLAPVDERDLEVVVTVVSAMLDRGVSAPRPLRTGDGRLLALSQDAWFTACTWVDLDDPRRDLDPDALGTLMARLHRDALPAGEQPVDPWYVDPVPGSDWLDVSDGLAEARAPFTAEFAASVPVFRSLQEEFTAPGQTQLCHRDLWADNVRNSGAGITVIDWDNCGPADPVQELAVPLAEFCARDVERAARLCRAYRRAGGTARLTDRGDFTMVLAQFGHFAITAGRQWLEATDETARGRAESWFREWYDEPFGLRQIDALLLAVRGI